jgi:hypothetical protein
MIQGVLTNSDLLNRKYGVVRNGFIFRIRIQLIIEIAKFRVALLFTIYLKMPNVFASNVKNDLSWSFNPYPLN